MVRFSCFHGHINSSKSKRAAQPSVEAMLKTLHNSSNKQTSSNTLSLHSLQLKDLADPQSIVRDKHYTISSPPDRDCKSEGIVNKDFNTEDDIGFSQLGPLKKSWSLGSRLGQEEMSCENIDTEDETYQALSCVDFHDHKEGNEFSDSPRVSSELVKNESIFSIGDPLQNPEKEGNEYSKTRLSGDQSPIVDSAGHTPRTLPVIIKSNSLPNVSSDECSPSTYSGPRCRSSEDVNVLGMRRKEILDSEVKAERDETRVAQDQERDDNICKSEDTYNYTGLAKHWIVPETDEENIVKYYPGESSSSALDQLPSSEFKIKRIEEWVMGLQDCGSLEESFDPSDFDDQVVKKDLSVLDGLAAAKLNGKVAATGPGIEAAKKYISSLSAAATTAQLSNHGLVVIPFLSAFVSLRVLNLSGNAIVRITAGALPRGLHTLNLSKNNISTIEGLRELTRLRVLDLSYNRIFRIGHGLASCSSLKELYLAGNKISEVEGLHRLLKLTVLDLRFNKISTAKCLGQLAANYGSLQAISLEGNPAQKNVGDEQLKKQLQGLLPHLAYFNRQPIKAGTLKDTAERSTRLGTGSHHLDRGLRSENKPTRKGGYGGPAQKPGSSTGTGPKRAKGRHGRLPPSGTRGLTYQRNQYFDFGAKVMNLNMDFPVHRSRSEGNLGAL